MKSLEELETMLLDEVKSYINREDNNISNGYYNQLTGNMSVILTLIFFRHVSGNNDWDYGWLDDSLLTKVEEHYDKFRIWGIMIRGKDGTTEQWTDPFYFEIKSNNKYDDYSEYSFLYGEKENDDVSYTEFNHDRRIWDFRFYSDKTWNPSERDWIFIFNKKRSIPF